MEGRHAQEKDVSLFQSLLLLLVTAVDILPAARLFFKTLRQVELVCAGQYP